MTGSLMYPACATRPDIAFAMSKLSRFVSKTKDVYLCVVERVMCYLKGTMSNGIHYIGYPMVLEGYSGVNLISNADEMKATSGYVFTIGGTIEVLQANHLNEFKMEAKLTTLEKSCTKAELLRELCWTC